MTFQGARGAPHPTSDGFCMEGVPVEAILCLWRTFAKSQLKTDPNRGPFSVDGAHSFSDVQIRLTRAFREQVGAKTVGPSHNSYERTKAG